MSMYLTLADKKRDSALDHIQKAIADLGEISVSEVDGYDEYNCKMITTCMCELMDLKKTIKKANHRA